MSSSAADVSSSAADVKRHQEKATTVSESVGAGVATPVTSGESKESKESKETADADINARNREGETALYRAARDGDLTSLNSLIAQKADVNLGNTRLKDTPLMIATIWGHEKCVQALLTARADVSARDNRDKTALDWAALQCHSGISSILLDAHVRALLLGRAVGIDALDKNGQTALHYAIEHEPMEVFLKLLKKTKNLNVKDSRDNTPLMLAASLGKAAYVRALLMAGANVEAQDLQGTTTALHIVACLEQHPETLEALCHKIKDINIKNQNGETPLHIAAENDNIEGVRILLNAEADVEAQDRKGATPLFHAASVRFERQSKRGILNLLIERGAKVNARNTALGTPLITAASKGLEGTVESLLEAGAEIDAQNKDGQTALHAAIVGSYSSYDGAQSRILKKLLNRTKEKKIMLEVTTLHSLLRLAVTCNKTACAGVLLDAGVEVDTKDENEETLLFLAARAQFPQYNYSGEPARGAPEMLNLLMTRKLDVNVRNKSLSTPLIEAVSRGLKENVKALLDAKADVEAQDSSGWTAFHFAISRGHYEILEMLLNSAKEKKILSDVIVSQSLLSRALRSCEGTDSIRVLLKAGADVNTKNKDGRTVLFEAVMREDESLNFLIANKADVNARDSTDRTPLIAAASSGIKKNVQALLNAGAKVEAFDKDCTTALHVAIEGNHHEILEMLLNNAKEKNMLSILYVPNAQGNLPLRLAASYYRAKCVRVLLEAGADVNAQDCQGIWDKDCIKLLQAAIDAKASGTPKTPELALEVKKIKDVSQDAKGDNESLQLQSAGAVGAGAGAAGSSATSAAAAVAFAYTMARAGDESYVLALAGDKSEASDSQAKTAP